MKKLIFLVVVFLGLPALATDLDSVLGSCQEDYEAELLDAKRDFLKSSIWNYDNDYGIDQVVAGPAYDLSANGEFKVDIYFDVEGLEDASYTYIFTPFFSDAGKTKCEYVRVDGPIEN